GFPSSLPHAQSTAKPIESRPVESRPSNVMTENDTALPKRLRAALEMNLDQCGLGKSHAYLR
ncbi:MAG TPA: hypothetical protein VIM73_06870, partial [Polyangiaceae bacterium]